ncbi:hypothetical protein FHW88_000005 [Mucilaginibacter sp. SG538B]|nr:hypothetical protein [Mucilaginibacter sp. SG538B]
MEAFFVHCNSPRMCVAFTPPIWREYSALPKAWRTRDFISLSNKLDANSKKSRVLNPQPPAAYSRQLRTW